MPCSLDLCQLDRFETRLLLATQKLLTTRSLLEREEAFFFLPSTFLFDFATRSLGSFDASALAFLFVSDPFVLQAHEFIERKEYGAFV
jgi:hypothetical protein